MAAEPTEPRDRTRHGAGAAPPHLPSPSLWPVTLALGIMLLGAGIVTHWLFALAGGLTMALALGGWVQELRQEARHAASAGAEEDTDERT